MRIKRIHPNYFDCTFCGEKQGNPCLVQYTDRQSKRPHDNRTDKAFGANKVIQVLEHDLNQIYLIEDEE